MDLAPPDQTQTLQKEACSKLVDGHVASAAQAEGVAVCPGGQAASQPPQVGPASWIEAFASIQHEHPVSPGGADCSISRSSDIVD